ncbi:MAG: hypothetical protein IIA45_11680 [Bacteroidetes bacterium]|nr:hypothetical protein [Bacteroidota bacterium]
MDQFENINLPFLVLAGTLTLIILAMSIIFFVLVYQKRLIRQKSQIQEYKINRQQKLLQATINGQEQERKRIAKELHDDIGAMLSTIRLYVDEEGENSARIKEFIDLGISSIRRIAQNLMPAVLEEFGLENALRDLFSNVEDMSMNVNLNYDIPDELDQEVELTIFRISQELLNNTIKHSGADSIELSLTFINSRIEIVYKDNGKGLNTKMDHQIKNGFGLKNIESRVHALGGIVNFRSEDQAGFLATIILENG